MKMIKIIYFIALLSLSGCLPSYLTVSQQRIDRGYLASTHVNTPDPRQEHPPLGQMLIVEWCVPDTILAKNPKILLKVLFRNYSEDTVEYPLQKRWGSKQYFLLNDEYEEKKGILSYKAEIITNDNVIYKEWTHQMWVNLISIKDKEEEEFEENLEKELPEDRQNDRQIEDKEEGEWFSS